MIRAAKRRKARAPNTMTADDVVIWRRLIAQGRAVAAAPMGDALKFVTAAEKAGGCCAPDGHRHPDSPFTALVRLGKRFLLLTLTARAEAAPEITGFCDAMDDALASAVVGSRRQAPSTARPPAPTYRAPYADNDQ